MKNFIEYLVKEIVDNPSAVTVSEKKDDSNTTYTIDVDQEDMGNVIGKNGRMIRSIRDLCKAKAIKDDIHIRIGLAEEQGGTLQPIEPKDKEQSEQTAEPSSE
jgi:predicted RNA-binding protein YlqC (UPF0109 family)